MKIVLDIQTIRVVCRHNFSDTIYINVITLNNEPLTMTFSVAEGQGTKYVSEQFGIVPEVVHMPG